jgi:hypothetical protein
MSERTFCYWSVADGPYADMMAAAVRSARAAGVREDFHVWSDREVPGAVTHPAGAFRKDLYLFKLEFLRDRAARLDYDYLVFLDADSYFVRHPGDVLASLHGAAAHVLLESDCTRPTNRRPDWWGCPLAEYVALMRARGVRGRSVYNTNAGFWVVHRDAAGQLAELAVGFWEHCRGRGYAFTEEAPLAYAGHMLVGNPYLHTLENNRDLWASDWVGVYAGRLPDGKPWDFEDYLDGRAIRVNPAIVHCMRSKDALIRAARGDPPPAAPAPVHGLPATPGGS